MLRLRLFVAIGFVAIFSQFVRAEPIPASQPARELSFLSMGDWGEGVPAQTSVAKELERYVAQQHKPIAAMVLVGDNFYVPLSGVDDPAWQTLFEQMYDPRALNFPFYVGLGNHDYDQQKFRIEMEYARLHPDSRWKLPAHWYRVDLPARDPMVSILMLDSNQPNLTPVAWREQIQWLETELAKPRVAPWVICCAHHPLFSNGAAADNGILQRDWGALFKKYHVDFYLCGHEHNLQHLEIPGWSTSFVLAGGGGAHLHPLLRNNRGPFSRSIHGFADFDLTPQRALVSYIGTDGAPLHVFERSKAGQIKVISTTPSDSPIDKPLEVITGLYDRIRAAQSQPTRSTTKPVSK